MVLKAGRPTGRTEAHVDPLKQQLADDEEEMRLNVRMSKSEYQKLKRFALDNDMSVSDVVRTALHQYMGK